MNPSTIISLIMTILFLVGTYYFCGIEREKCIFDQWF